MSRGYKTLVADKFFGNVDNIDWDQVKLIDKINLEAKIGNLVDVPFNDEEKALFLKTMHTEEFSEVLDVVREILAYSKDKQEDLMNPPKMPDFDDTDNDDDNEDPTSNMGHDDMEAKDGEDEQQQNSGNQSGNDNETEEDEEQTITSTNPEHSDEDFSVTDRIFRNMEKTLIPESSEFHYGNEIKNWKKHVIDHDTLMKKREIHFNKQFKMYSPDSYWVEENFVNQMPLKHNQEVEFIDYIKRAKKAIQPAVKEFEQKKAAHRWMHASTAKTGRLDVNKLHNYKLTEDIFLKTTRLADDKNHGMFMLIDYSGSMSYQLSPVLEQVIHSILFCKAVNIPFDVYSFSTNCWDAQREFYDGDIQMDDLSMCQLIHSGLKKKELENALKWLYARTDHARGCTNDWIKCKEEDWGSTPLNQALIISHKLIKQFRNRHNIEKVTLLSITDGDTNRLRVVDDRKIEKIETTHWDNQIKINLDGQTLTIWGGRKGTKTLYENLRNRYDVNVMGFFVADCNSQFRRKIHDAYCDQVGREVFECDYDYEEFRKAKVKENTKNRCIEFKDTLGYNNFFLVKGNSFNIEDEELDNFIDTDEEVTDSQIKSAFRKMAKNKKTNKNLMTKFGEAVAS